MTTLHPNQQPVNDTIGFIGLGEMGLGMAPNLQKFLAAQGKTLTVWNRTPDKAAALEKLGAHVASSIEQVFERSNIIFTCLANDTAVEAVYAVLFELASNVQHPVVFVEASTIYPTFSTKLAQQLSAFPQHTFLQCPVFGRPPAAHAAQLVFVTSGPAKVLERVQPYVDSMSRKTIDLKTTDVGKASTFKLLGNFFVAGTMELLAEGFNLAEKTDIDQEAVLGFIQTLFPSPVWIGYSQKFADREGPKDFPVNLWLKDVGHMKTLAAEKGTTLPTADVLHRNLKVAKGRVGKSEYGEWDSLVSALRDAPAL